MNNQKIYCGSGKEFGQYGAVNVSICLSDLPKEHINDFNGKKYIKLIINKKREADQFGKTHSVEVNTWKPDQQQQQGYDQSPPQDLSDSELPF
jgi:hypothetical protein